MTEHLRYLPSHRRLSLLIWTLNIVFLLTVFGFAGRDVLASEPDPSGLSAAQR